MKLNPILKKRFRTIGHQIKPVVTISTNGITDNIVLEFNRALEDHELIKIKLDVPDREARSSMAATLLEQANATQIDSIGKIVLCYRAAEKPNRKLSNILRFTG